MINDQLDKFLAVIYEYILHILRDVIFRIPPVVPTYIAVFKTHYFSSPTALQPDNYSSLTASSRSTYFPRIQCLKTFAANKKCLLYFDKVGHLNATTLEQIHI